MDLGIGWEAGGEKTMINEAAWDRLTLAKPLAPYIGGIVLKEAPYDILKKDQRAYGMLLLRDQRGYSFAALGEQ